MSGASAALVALAERLAAPVITTLSGRGSMPDTHPLEAGGLGGHRNDLSKQLLADADVVFSVGARWEQMECNWRPGFVPSSGAVFIQSDIYSEEFGRAIVPNITVTGDARLVLEDVAAALADTSVQADRARVENDIRKVLDNLEESADEVGPGTEGQIHPIYVIRATERVFPADKVVGFDVGFMAQQMAGAYPLGRTAGPRSVISPSSFYGMGFVAAAMPAARVVYPDRTAICFVGDGSFQMVMNVLPTAVEHKLPVTWIVMNDMGLGSIFDIQKYNFGDRILGTEYSFAPDFAGVARACGCFGEQVTDPAKVEAAMARALEANRAGQPAVLDIMVARERTVAAREFFPLEGDAGGWSPKPL